MIKEDKRKILQFDGSTELGSQYQKQARERAKQFIDKSDSFLLITNHKDNNCPIMACMSGRDIPLYIELTEKATKELKENADKAVASIKQFLEKMPKEELIPFLGFLLSEFQKLQEKGEGN